METEDIFLNQFIVSKVKEEPIKVFIKQEIEDSCDDNLLTDYELEGEHKSNNEIKVDEVVKPVENCRIFIKSENICDELSENDTVAEIERSEIAQNTRKVSKKKPITCTFCNKIFRFPSYLKTHLLSHTGEKPYECSICKKTFQQRNQLKAHIFKHKGLLPYKCEVCCKGFVSKNNIKRHMMTHAKKEKTLETETEVDCDVKAEESSDPLLINDQSIEEIHVETIKVESLLVESKEKKKSAKNITYMCTLCEKDFPFASALKTHMMKHSGEKPFKCEICGKGFSNKSYLMSHMFEHNGEQPFKCDICSKAFASGNNLKRHMLSHTGEKPFECEFCQNRYACQTSFRRHKQKHINADGFKCEQCLKKFPTKFALQRHQITHKEKIKPHQCEVCNKHFSQKTVLKYHMMRHMGVKRFICDQCGAGFQLNCKLVQHLLVHSNEIREKKFNCTVCQKMLSTAENLKKHMRIHTGERPYKCEFCEKSFKQTTHLQSHKLIHTGCKPFVCDICGNGYTQKTALKKHMRSHQ